MNEQRNSAPVAMFSVSLRKFSCSVDSAAGGNAESRRGISALLRDRGKGLVTGIQTVWEIERQSA
jgi:hypothetical protein